MLTYLILKNYFCKKYRFMGLKCGIVGLPNVGKSTLFNCLTNAKAQAANFPFCTIEPNVGMITVPDSRLNELEKLIHLLNPMFQNEHQKFVLK